MKVNSFCGGLVVQLLSHVRLLQSCGLQPARLLCPWDFPGKNTGVGCHFLLQGIFPTQELNLGLLHCRQITYQQSYFTLCNIIYGGKFFNNFETLKYVLVLCKHPLCNNCINYLTINNFLWMFYINCIKPYTIVCILDFSFNIFGIYTHKEYIEEYTYTI